VRTPKTSRTGRGPSSALHGRVSPALAAVTALILVVAAVAPAAWAAPSGSLPKRVVSKPAAAANGGRREAERALARARATGKRILVRSLTTPNSTTVANPRGTFTLTQTAEPTRMLRGGRWVTLDSHLHMNSDKSLSPNAVSSPLRLSGGGNGPLATMTHLGRTLALSWPAPLPVPLVKNAVATYREVLPSVDLVVTVSTDGGFSDVLVVKTKQAAADPRLAQLTLATKTSGGLVVATDSAGDLTARTSAKGAVVFSAPAPTMWDSATADRPAPAASPSASPKGKAPKAATPKVPGGTQHHAQIEASTVQAPGTNAHTARIKATAAQPTQAGSSRSRSATQTGSLTLVPDQSLLTGASTVFPVYIDPSVGPGTKYSISVSDFPGSRHDRLQVGYCGWSDCSGGFKARSFVRVTVDSKLRGATIISSQLNFPFAGNTASGCTSARVTQLWWTGGISSSTSWPGPSKNSYNGGAIDTSQGSWGADCTAAQRAAGAGFGLKSFMQDKATGGAKTMTFGLYADETDTNAWRQFDPNFTMRTEFNHAPTLPGYAATLPGGPCKTDPASTVVGNDDVTLQVVPSDPDGGQLTTKFVVANAGGSVVYDSSTDSTVHSPKTYSGKVAQIPFDRTTFTTKWHADGATKAYRYTWWTQSTDDGIASSPVTGLGSKGSPCGFTFDPTAPQAPGIQPPADDLPMGVPGSITVAACATVLDTPPVACATSTARYIYQLNDGPTTRVSASGTQQNLPITPTHVGVNTITVTGLSAAGNPGPSNTRTFTVAAPTTASADGDIDRDTKPDLLTVGSTSTPGMWLAPSDGAGKLATPTDIGALGTGIGDGGGPGEWNGATVLHGNFTGNNVQDVIAYYPAGTHVGNTKLLYGTGDGQALNPLSGSQLSLPPDQLMDDNGNVPIQMVAAGNASLTRSTANPTIDDLATISGDTTNGYTLNLVTGTSFDGYNDPNAHPMIVIAAPGTGPGAATWDKYRLLAAQPTITVAGAPTAQTHLYALDTTTGTIWEAVNTTDGTTTTWGTVDTGGIPVQPTWTKLTGATIPNPISADLNTAGQIELWGTAGLTATNYTLSGTTITKGTSTSLLAPAHAWPLTDGGTALSAADTNGASPATFSNTGVTWINPTNEQIHATAAQLDGTTGYLTLPAGLLHASNVLTLTLAFQAQPGTNGILFSTGNDTPDKANGAAMPVMYIGTDGRLYAQFWNGGVTPMISPQPVNDGQWHRVTLTSTGTHQGLYLDANIRIGMAGSSAVNNGDPLNYAGAGVFPANTAAKTWVNAPGDTTKNRARYFTGLLADIAYYTTVLYDSQLDPLWQPRTMTGPIRSNVTGVANPLCIDDAAPHNTNNDKIQIYTCNNSPAQTWNLNPDGTITLPAAGKCLDIAGNGTANGTKIDLYTCVSGALNQQWHLDSNGQIWNQQSGRCLDDPSASTTLGTQLQIYDCNLTNAQYWIDP
jgi:hypothetical protein